MSTPFLSIRGIRKAYGGVVAVEDVSLDIAEGEFVTFLGPSGSGKSTTLYVLAGFLEPSAGDVLLNGQSLLRVPSNKRNIGMVFQRYTLFPHLSVADNVAFPLRVRRRPKAEVDARVEEMLRLVRLEQFRDRMPAQLSGGQQQRVALARALSYDPPLLLMDEPLSALDKKLREEIQTEIKRVHSETGVTILYVTHDQEEALRLSDRIALFNHGRIEQVGPGRDLYDRPRTRFVGGFIGNSNFLPARVTESHGTRATITCPNGFVLRDVPLVDQVETEEDSVLMIRPEHMWIEPESDPMPTEELAGKLLDASYLGNSMVYTVRTAWQQEVVVRTPLNSRRMIEAETGSQVRLAWRSEDSRLFRATR